MKRPRSMPGQNWDPGQVRSGRMVVANTRAETLQSVISMKGHWNCCDVWLKAPRDAQQQIHVLGDLGWDDVELQLWGQNGQIETIFDRRFVSDNEGIALPQNSVDPHVECVLLSVRGRECDGFEVKATTPTLDPPDNTLKYRYAEYRIECWGDDSAEPNDDQGRCIVDPYSPRHKLWDVIRGWTGAIGSTWTVIYTQPTVWPLTTSRAYITAIQAYSTDAASTRTIAIARRTNAPGPRDTRWQGILASVAQGSMIEVVFPSPLRGYPGGSWEVNISGLTAATTASVNVQGFFA